MTYRNNNQKGSRKFSPREGVRRQEEALTIEELNKALEKTCKEFCKGIYYEECEHCPVSRVHKERKQTIELLREIEETRRQQKEREVARLKDLEDEALSIYLAVRSCRDILEHEAELEALADQFLRYKDGMVMRR
jgi:hypothetical protein